MADRRSKPPTPVVALKRCRCPRCGSLEVKTTRTVSRDAELVEQRKRCQACRCAFIAILD